MARNVVKSHLLSAKKKLINRKSGFSEVRHFLKPQNVIGNPIGTLQTSN
jgi:hypothetical protein